MTFHAGDRRGGEQALRELIARYPKQSLGYAELADHLGQPAFAGGDLDVPEARRVLAAGLAAAEDADSYELAERLEELGSLT